jgi:hypothetical protein
MFLIEVVPVQIYNTVTCMGVTIRQALDSWNSWTHSKFLFCWNYYGRRLENILSRFLANDNINIYDACGQGCGNDLNLKGKIMASKESNIFKTKDVLYALCSSQIDLFSSSTYRG